MYNAEESKIDDGSAYNPDGSDDASLTKRDSSRISNRGLIDQSLKFGPSRKKKNKKSSGPKIYSKRHTENDSDAKKRKDSENSKEGEVTNEDDKDASLDHNKMLKDIKISNNKLNMVTLSVILVFLTYFSTCFGISLSYLNQIQSQVQTNTQLYSEQPALQYTYLYFLTDILLDNT